MDNKTKQVLYGSLLGDGSIAKETNHFIEGHTIKQKEYLLWKSQFLRDFNLRIFYYKNNNIKVISIKTKTTPYFKKLRKIFYPNDKKIVTEEILNQIELLGLAIWYIDDGNYDYYYRRCRLFTNCFSLEEQRLIKNWFITKWGLNPTITKNSKYYHLSFNAKDSDTFLRLIINEVLNIPSEIYYKLGHLFEGNKTKLEEKRKLRLQTSKEYYKNHREDRLEYVKNWQKREDVKKGFNDRMKNDKEFRDRIRGYKRNYKIRHKEKLKEKSREQSRIYYQKNREKILEGKRHKPKIKYCVMCKEDIKNPKSNRQITCGSECSKLNNKIKHKIWKNKNERRN